MLLKLICNNRITLELDDNLKSSNIVIYIDADRLYFYEEKHKLR